MPTKYKIQPRWSEAKIEEVEIVRETESCVFLPIEKNKRRPNGERKESKNSEYHDYYDTWEEAHAALMEHAEQEVISARRSLEKAGGFYASVKGMKRN